MVVPTTATRADLIRVDQAAEEAQHEFDSCHDSAARCPIRFDAIRDFCRRKRFLEHSPRGNSRTELFSSVKVRHMFNFKESDLYFRRCLPSSVISEASWYTSRDASKDASQAASREATGDASRDTSRDASGEATGDASGDASRDVSREASRDVS